MKRCWSRVATRLLGIEQHRFSSLRVVHRRGPATMREVDLRGEDVIERLLLVVVHACPEGALPPKRSGKTRPLLR
jgi:hypothetical protein